MLYETHEILMLIQDIGYSIEYEYNKLKEEKQKLIKVLKKNLIN